MKYFIFKIEWSQTEDEFVIIEAKSREDAEKYLRRNGSNGPRYVTCYGQTCQIIKCST